MREYKLLHNRSDCTKVIHRPEVTFKLRLKDAMRCSLDRRSVYKQQELVFISLRNYL